MEQFIYVAVSLLFYRFHALSLLCRKPSATTPSDQHTSFFFCETAMSSTNPLHIPLTSSTDQIRLLKLQPGAGTIRVTMQSYNLTESPPFVALSYEWGDDSEMHDIMINEQAFKIRRNLRDALQHIRILQADRSSTRLFDENSPHFWIDAIAIDQSNSAERAHQVSIMGNIFRQASHVIAWLGLEQPGDNSAAAMKHLNLGVDGRLNPSLSTTSVTISAEEKKKAVRMLCLRSYFERIWIVQECVLARKLHLVCGLQYCHWKHLHEFFFFSPFDQPKCDLANNLFSVKSLSERDWDGKSIQDTMYWILTVAVGRHCSQIHDRIYGLLGIIQQSFRSTGMVVDYSVSREELMINTLKFLTSDPQNDDPSNYPYWVQRVVEPDISMDVRGKVAWYWQINEIMHKLDADVIKGFHKVEALGGEKERALTFQTICWIVGGYGVDLFSAVKDTTSPNTATTMPTISLESLKNNESREPNRRIFNMHSRYTTGTLTFCVSLTHRPCEPYSLPDDYVMTESNSWGCRTLLETYSKHVQSLGRMRESFHVSSTKASDLQKETQLPIQVEWTVFSNLLAQCFLDKYSTWGHPWCNRKTRTDDFLRRVEPEGKDLGIFLTESLFSKYDMRVTETFDKLPANVLKVEIEITDSNDADHCSGSRKKILVASLYDNDAHHYATRTPKMSVLEFQDFFMAADRKLKSTLG